MWVGFGGLMSESRDRRREGRKEEVKGGRGQGDGNWPGSGRWCGAVAGWNMCVRWGWGDYGANAEVTEETAASTVSVSVQH